MLKVLIAVSIISSLVVVGFLSTYLGESIKEPPVDADVIMSTKSSRPGCEKDDTCYVPSQITIDKGKMVTWVNQDSAFHSVTSGFYDAPTALFDSGHLDPLESFSFRFDETGEYPYYCTLHPWMESLVIVK